MTYPNEDDQTPTLTIMGCVRACYSVFWHNYMLFLQTSIIPVLVISLSAFVLPAPDYSLPMGANTIAKSQHMPHVSLAGIAFAAAGWFLIVSFQVTWQRFLVLGDKPSVLYFKAPFWSYLGASLLLMLALMGWMILSFIPLIIASVAATAIGAKGALMFVNFLLALVCFIPSYIWFVRRMLIFPARALGNKDLTWKQSSQAMKGHVLKFFITGILVYIPILIPGVALMVAMIIGAAQMSPALLYLAQAIQQFLMFAGIAIMSAVPVYFYKALIDCRPVS